MEHSVSTTTPVYARPAQASLLETWATPLVTLITAIPLIGAYFFIGQSLRLDESQSLWQVSRDVPGILALVAGDVHVPLYHLVLHYWRAFLGDSILVARLLSLLFFTLSIPALYLLGKRAYSVRAGVLAAFLFAISPFMNWYASEIRMYTLFVFLTILNQYLFLRIIDEKKPRVITWVSYALVNVLGVYTHYFFFLNLIAQGIFYLLRRSHFARYTFWRLLSVAVVVLGALSPWVWYVFSRGVAGFQEPLLAAPSFVDLFSTFSQFLFGFQSDALNTILLSLWPVAIIFGLIALQRSQRFLLSTEFFVCTLLIAFGITFFESHLFAPIYVSRYLVFTLPAFYLILVNLFSTYATGLRRFSEASLIALMLITFGIQVLNPVAPVKENYREAVAYLSSHTTAQDTILVSAPFTIYPVQYYYRGPSPVSTIPVWNQYAYGPIPAFRSADLPSIVASSTRNYQRVYLLLSYNQGYEQTIKQYFDTHFERLSAETFSNDLSLYVYRLRYNTELSVMPDPATTLRN